MSPLRNAFFGVCIILVASLFSILQSCSGGRGPELKADAEYSAEELYQKEQNDSLEAVTGQRVLVSGKVTGKGMTSDGDGNSVQTLQLEVSSGEIGDAVIAIPKDKKKLDEVRKGDKVKIAGKLVDDFGPKVKNGDLQIQ